MEDVPRRKAVGAERGELLQRVRKFYHSVLASEEEARRAAAAAREEARLLRPYETLAKQLEGEVRAGTELRAPLAAHTHTAKHTQWQRRTIILTGGMG